MEGKARPKIYCDLLVDDIQKLMDDAKIQKKYNKVTHVIVHASDFISIRHNP